MSYNNDDRRDLIEEELYDEALDRQFNRIYHKHEVRNNMFLSLFPKDKRDKVLDIEERVMLLLLFAFFIYFIIMLCTH